MINTLIQQLNLTTIILIAALIITFIIASKIMEMIFDTAIVAAISAGFYLALRTIQGGTISFNDLIFFTFLGSTIYMTYNTLQTLYKVGSTIVTTPIKIIKTILKPVKYLFTKIKQIKGSGDYDYNSKNEKPDNKSKTKDKEDKSTKEVILGNKEEKANEGDN